MPTRICKWTQNAKMVKAHGEAHIPPGAFCGLEPAGLSGGGDPRGGGACTEGPRPPTVLFAGRFKPQFSRRWTAWRLACGRAGASGIRPSGREYWSVGQGEAYLPQVS